MKLASLRPAVLVAWRQARRQRLRSVAMVLLLVVPVAGVSGFDVVYRSTHLSAAEQADRTLGGADAVLDWFGNPVVQAPDPAAGGVVPTESSTGAPEPGPSSPPLRSLPRGSTATPEADAQVDLVSSKTALGVLVRGVDLRSPGPAAGVRVRSGSVPAGAGQIALSPSAASQLGAGIGSTLQVPGGDTTLRVVGIVADRYHPDETVAFTTTSAAEQLQDRSALPLASTGVTRWYVSAPGGVAWSAVEALNRQGWEVTSRLVVDHPPPRSQVPYYRPSVGGGPSPAEEYGSSAPAGHRTTEVGAGVLAVLLVLEVVLLCGPAFAVGSRRRRQQLGVIGAGAGATPAQLAWFVVADGLVLGVGSALAGAALGVGVGAAVLALNGWWAHQVPGPLTLRGWEIAGIAALAVLSGLLSSLPPAWSASRLRSASRPRSGSGTGRRLQPAGVWGVGMAGLGMVGLGMVAIAVALGATRMNEASNGGFPVPLVVAAALGEVGLVCLTPAILSLMGRAAGRLPLWPRIALRETARRRSAAAATAAVIAVTAAATAALVYGSSVAAHDRVSWIPYTPVGDGVVFVTANPGGASIDAEAAYTAVRSGLPGSTVELLDGQTSGPLVVPLAPGCTVSSVSDQEDQGNGYSLAYSGGSACELGNPGTGAYSYLVDTGPGAAAMVGGAAGRQAEAALQSGKAVVFDPRLVAPDGKVTLAVGQSHLTTVAVPAVAVDSGLPVPLASVVLPPSLAATLHLDPGPVLVYVKDAAAQPASNLRAVDLALTKLGIESGLDVQAPYTNGVRPVLWAVTGAGALLTVAATVAAAALLGADSLDDLFALFAIGADPQGRRRLATSRAAVVGAVGSVLGTAAGLLPGAALVWRLRQQNLDFTRANASAAESFGYPLSFPWSHLAILVAAAPLLAVLVTALLSRRSRPAGDRADRPLAPGSRPTPVGYPSRS